MASDGVDMVTRRATAAAQAVAAGAYYEGGEMMGAGNPNPPEEERVPKAKKFNKIGIMPQHMGAAAAWPGDQQMEAVPPTPFLDNLSPLRRSQFLQLVLRQVKATGGMEADKTLLAEDYLRTYEGNYEKAFEYVKALSQVNK